jgi:hypothetical protein
VTASAAPALAAGIEALWREIEAAAPLAYVDPDDGLTPDDDSLERRLAQSDRRRSFIARYAWAVPDRRAIAAIAGFVAGERLIEVGAGSGLWARLLLEAGVDVIATDYYEPPATPYVAVEQADAAAAVQRHSDCRALLLCWPPYRQDCALRALQAFAGDTLVYAGDVRFTADRQFHYLLAAQWQLIERLKIPAWPGLDDHVYLYRRRKDTTAESDGGGSR